MESKSLLKKVLLYLKVYTESLKIRFSMEKVSGSFTSGMLLLFSVSVRFLCYLNLIQCVFMWLSWWSFIPLIFIFCIFLFYFQQEATHSNMNIRRKILSLSDLQTCSLLQLNALRASLNEDIQGIFFLKDPQGIFFQQHFQTKMRLTNVL